MRWEPPIVDVLHIPLTSFNSDIRGFPYSVLNGGDPPHHILHDGADQIFLARGSSFRWLVSVTRLTPPYC